VNARTAAIAAEIDRAIDALRRAGIEPTEESLCAYLAQQAAELRRSACAGYGRKAKGRSKG